MLELMHMVTKQSKRSISSYAIKMLHEEFEKWLEGDNSTKFGVDYEVKRGWAKWQKIENTKKRTRKCS